MLGCLFDHGCDCIVNIAHCELVLSLLPGASVSLVAGGLMMVQFTFFIAQWKHYVTGIHDISCGPVGVTELQGRKIGEDCTLKKWLFLDFC